jgi:hypothetical protein
MFIHFHYFTSVESVRLCSGNEIANGRPIFLITFGFGLSHYSKDTPANFNFTTSYRQNFESDINNGLFGFVNAVPNARNGWHSGALDHTENDTNGYMYLVNVDEINSTLFNFTANNLCIGLRYQLSVYLANADKKQSVSDLIEPNIRFEVRTATVENRLLSQNSTGNTPAYDAMNWSKHSLSFIASTSSVVLLMLSNVGGDMGNDIAVDDIELRVCSTVHSGLCRSGEYIYRSLDI